VASDVFGKSGLAILRTIADGCTNAGVLASKVTTKIKRSEEIKKSLTNCLTQDHCFVVKELMSQYDHLEERIRSVENELVEKVQPYRHLVDELDKIPGIDQILAIGILAEATTDMSAFADERKFAAWAGVAAGNNESGGKKKDQNAVKAIPTSGGSWRKRLTGQN
jgi:transposase